MCHKRVLTAHCPKHSWRNIDQTRVQQVQCTQLQDGNGSRCDWLQRLCRPESGGRAWFQDVCASLKKEEESEIRYLYIAVLRCGLRCAAMLPSIASGFWVCCVVECQEKGASFRGKVCNRP